MKHLIAGIMASSALIISLPSSASAADAALASQRPCKQEDSTSCVWDARHRGNGEGRSFWADDTYGKRAFYSHKIAHRLLHGEWSYVSARLVGQRIDLVKGGTRKITEHSRISFGDTTYVVWPHSTDVGTS